MSAECTGEPAFGTFELYSDLVDSYVPFYRTLARGQCFEADDVRQEIRIKFLKRFKTADDWQQIKNKKAYVVQTAKHVAFTLRQDSPVNHDSLDDDENIKLKNISDEGISFSQINDDIDNASTLNLINKMLEKFSEYERLLIQLNIIEGCKPIHVAKLVIKEYFATFQKVYPKLTCDDYEEVRKFVQADCNAVAAKFRQKLRKELGNIDKNTGKKKSENE